MLRCEEDALRKSFLVVSDFHGASGLNLVVVVVVAVAADAAQVVALIGLLAGFVDLFLCGVLCDVFCT